MKKTIFILLIILILFGCEKKEEKDKIQEQTTTFLPLIIKDNLEFEYASNLYLYDLIDKRDSTITSDNIKIDTLKLGTFTTTIEYIDNNKKLSKEINYSIVDKTKPLVLINSTLTVDKGTKNVVNKVVCADNYDKRPKCVIEGNYDVNKVGTYDNLKYIATDSSGNTVSHNFKLKVVNPSKSNSSNKEKYKIEDLIKKQKNENTMIGIDVSSWQSNIDFNKVKKAGVEFVMIRIGFGHNKKGELVMDNKFKNNIKNAKKAGLKIGIYFYSYANTNDKAKEQVKWIVKQLGGEKLDLPIAFDWEDWRSFNSYNMNLYDIKQVANTFINECKKNGYDSVLYSSKYYLEEIWGVDEFDTWLAHYTSKEKSSYKGNYMMWQLSSRGKVPGISGNVDLDVLYK